MIARLPGSSWWFGQGKKYYREEAQESEKNEELGNMAEREVADKFPFDKPAMTNYLDHKTIHPPYSLSLIGSEYNKSDIVVSGEGGNAVGVSVKSFAEGSGSNQVWRVASPQFMDVFGFGGDLKQYFSERLSGVGSGKYDYLFESGDDGTNEVLRNIQGQRARILTHALAGSIPPIVCLIAIVRRQDNQVKFFDVDDLISQSNSLSEAFVSKNRVIQINPFFTLQRKGGDGINFRWANEHGSEDLRSRENDIQIKMKTKKVWDNIPSLCVASPTREGANIQSIMF